MSNPNARLESLGEYLAHLPLSDEQRAELASCASFSELHQRLSAQPDAREAVQASVGSRLTVGSAAELEEAEMLGVDAGAGGRLSLKIAPPIKRTRVLPEPWRTNVLVRIWRRLTGRSNPAAAMPRSRPSASCRRHAGVGSARCAATSCCC